ncbi:hypothetical protein ABPG72_019462 [Tetrahymena utriculariae]
MNASKILIIGLTLTTALIGAAFYMNQDSPLAQNPADYLDVVVSIDPNHDETDLTCNRCYTNADTCPCDDYSIFQWAACYKYSVPTCDDGPASDRQACYRAASAVADLVYPSAKHELNACKNWYSYFERTTADARLNKNRWFECCFADSRVLSLARKSQFYYQRIYKKLYLECGNINY